MRPDMLTAEEIADIIKDWDDIGLLTEGQAEVLAERIAMSLQVAAEASVGEE